MAEMSSPTPEDAVGPLGSLPCYNQKHTVEKDATVTIHGGIFSVKDDVYTWQLRNSHGVSEVLGNTNGSEPWFIPDEIGDYLVTLPTTQGLASFTFHVI